MNEQLLSQQGKHRSCSLHVASEGEQQCCREAEATQVWVWALHQWTNYKLQTWQSPFPCTSHMHGRQHITVRGET